MVSYVFDKQFLAKLSLIACTMLWVSGCAVSGQNSESAKSAEVTALQEELKTNELTIIKLKAELETVETANGQLRIELDRTKKDLEYVEEQFVSLERGLQSHETKASAVAALAEAKLAVDRILRENPAAVDLPYVKDAQEKIQKSDQLLQQKRYAASVYFAKRALRLPEEDPVSKTIRIVSVSRANMRRGPGMNYDVVAQLTLGTVLVELENDGDWFRVETKGGSEGWIHRSLTR